VACLAALAALIALSAMSDSGRSTEKLPPQPDLVYLALQEGENRGTVKRFSQRNGWGLITCEVPDHQDIDPRSPGEPRRDVRFYRKEKEDLSLNVGDTVTFRAVPDSEAPGWLKVVELQLDARACTAAGEVQPSVSEPSNLASEVAHIGEGALGHEPVPGGDPPEDFLQGEPALVEATCASDTQSAFSSALPERPTTTPVVARRLVHSQLEVPLSPEQLAEEKAFWKSPPRSQKTSHVREHDSCEHGAAEKQKAPAAAPLKRQPLATLRAATAPNGAHLLTVAAATSSNHAVR
jgi:hypothetical protein